MSVLHSEFRDWARKLTPVEVLQMLVADMPSEEQAKLLDEAGVSLVGMHGALVLRDYGRDYLKEHRLLGFENERTMPRLFTSGTPDGSHQRFTLTVDFRLDCLSCKGSGIEPEGDYIGVQKPPCAACGGSGQRVP